MKKWFFIFVLLFINAATFAQGCSDAGFCSLQNTSIADSTKVNSIAIGFGYGAGFEDVNVLNSYLEYGRIINKKFSVQAKLVFLNAEGTLGSNSGLGDVFVTANYKFKPNKNYNYSLWGGFKIPLNDANDQNNSGFSLPLDYQTSIGTYDFLLGSNLVFKSNWELGLALQSPIINKNDNQFFSASYANSENFITTNKFQRKPDGLFRISYNYKLHNTRLSFKPNLLAIYHFGEDRYTNIANQKINIKGSDGITLNGGIESTYTFKNQTQLALITAIPFAVRTIRPDGLTRSYVINLQYKIQF